MVRFALPVRTALTGACRERRGARAAAGRLCSHALSRCRWRPRLRSRHPRRRSPRDEARGFATTRSRAAGLCCRRRCARRICASRCPGGVPPAARREGLPGGRRAGSARRHARPSGPHGDKRRPAGRAHESGRRADARRGLSGGRADLPGSHRSARGRGTPDDNPHVARRSRVWRTLTTRRSVTTWQRTPTIARSSSTGATRVSSTRSSSRCSTGARMR
jgi:hypothetical protein